GGLDVGFLENARHGARRAFPRGAAGAKGHRNEFRLQRGKPRNRVPETLFHFLRLGREEFERYPGGLADIRSAGKTIKTHQTVSVMLGAFCSQMVSLASHKCGEYKY